MIQLAPSLPRAAELPQAAGGPLPFRRALVTGASGFIGGHLVAALQARGVAVRCLVRATSNRADVELPGVEFARADLDEGGDLAEALDGIDCVFHLAGRVAALRVEHLFETNARGTARLAEACARAARPPVLVHCSSIAASGPVAPGRIRAEADPPRPVSDYGRSKLAGELAVRRWVPRVATTIVRPGIVFGPRCRDLIPMFQSVADFRMHFVPSFNPPPLSLLHVADLVELLLRAAAAGERLPAPGDRAADLGTGCYFAATPEHPDYTQLGRLLGQAYDGRSPLVVHMPELTGWMVAVASEWMAHWQNSASVLNRDKIREALAPSWAVSGEKAARQLGFLPAASLAQRLAETALWYRQAGWTR